MSLRRGFKTEANSIAREVRDELGLRSDAPLDTLQLAKHLCIRVRGIRQLRRSAPAAVAHFVGDGQGSFSAVTIFEGVAREIWHNDAHAPGRQASNIAHELAHALLLHPAGGVSFNGRDWDGEQEEEAQWLGGALLVSDEAAIVIARAEWLTTEAALRYGVSEQLMGWRLGVTGARVRVARAHAKYGTRAPS